VEISVICVSVVSRFLTSHRLETETANAGRALIPGQNLIPLCDRHQHIAGAVIEPVESLPGLPQCPTPMSTVNVLVSSQTKWRAPFMRKTVFVCALLATSAPAWSQIKISTITDETTPSSKAVMADFRQKISSHPKQFALVSNKDSDQSLIVQIDCMPQTQSTAPYVCYYISHYSGGSSKTLMGGGIDIRATASEMADNILVSVAQDITERWKEIVRSNAIESLEACLFLTQSSCKVPGKLTAELKANVINLSQYLQKGGLKK